MPDVHARTEEARRAARGSPAPCPPLLQPVGGLGWALAGRQPMTKDMVVSSALQFEKDFCSLLEKKPEECTLRKIYSDHLVFKKKKMNHKKTFYI